MNLFSIGRYWYITQPLTISRNFLPGIWGAAASLDQTCNTPLPIATRPKLQWIKAELFSWESCHTSITTRHTVIKTKLFSWESCLCAKSCKQCILLQRMGFYFAHYGRYSLKSAGLGFLDLVREAAHSHLYVIVLAQKQDYNQVVIRSPDSDIFHILLHHAHQLGIEVMLAERDMAQWLEHGALSMSLTAVRFRIPLGGGFLGKYHVSPLSMFGHCFDVLALGKAPNPQMLHLTQVKMSTFQSSRTPCNCRGKRGVTTNPTRTRLGAVLKVPQYKHSSCGLTRSRGKPLSSGLAPNVNPVQYWSTCFCHG